MKSKKRSFRWWMIPAALLVLIALVLLGGRLYFRLPVQDYYQASQKAFTLPGLWDGYVEQGMAYLPENDQLLLTGYYKDHRPSPLYVIDRANGKVVKQVTFMNAEGQPCTGHNGGITVHEGFIYLCDSDRLRVFDLGELLTAGSGDALHEVGMIPLTAGDDRIGPAFVEAGAEGLIVGEFYYPKTYETPLSHYVGDHHALAVLLPYDDSAVGVGSVPVRAYSLPDKAQGMCFDDAGRMFISESWGAAASVIEVFQPGEPTGSIQVLGAEIPMVMLDAANRVAARKIAPMSEEMAIVDGRLYINCEAASMKYLFGKLTGASWMYATELSFFVGQ